MGPALGWTAGALLEKAGTALGEPPTSEALLAGLWSIKEDTLGGITSPLTFVKNQPPSPKACWFNFELRQRTWVSPDKFTLHCK
jgi:branched-chain amino acid transport system substrate-binding protein